MTDVRTANRSPATHAQWARRMADRYGVWLFILLGVADRTIVILRSASRIVSTDDAVTWCAAMDYGHARFRGPYYYGQDYGPMLEALVAAPFARAGLPLWYLMPIVSSVLCLLPFWSFALWHNRHRHAAAAICFALIPLLLPVEYGLMTSMPRGFITGIAPLALLPWITGLRDAHARPLLTGTVISIAWYINPNSAVFSAGYACWYLLSNGPGVKHALLLSIGAVPGILAHLSSKAWCDTYPDRIVHRLRPDQFTFDLSRMLDGISRLDAHLQWLMPLVWPVGSLAGVLLVVFAAEAFRRRQWPLAIGSSASVVLIMLSLGFGKIHDGSDSVFFPLSRMFLALPLALAWCASLLIRSARLPAWALPMLAIVAVVAVGSKASTLDTSTGRQIRSRHEWVGVNYVTILRADERQLRGICDRHCVGLIIPLQLPSGIWPQFRAYLYPALDEALPPTYLFGYERRYWIREALKDPVVPNILITGGSKERWNAIMAADGRFMEPDGPGPADVHVLIANTERTDSLASRLMHELRPR